ncbi:MAG: hypothetical protein M1524_02490 [Patescibacteria group bacterium]|nr:hypothetical protein [Patescibacteria group bacterium]
MEKVFWDKKNYSLPIYQDVKDLLLFLKSNKNLIIGIFSKGNKRHQKQKINSLKEIFEEENIHIFLEKKDKLAFILKKYENNQLYFVDDSLMILREVKITDKNACTIWIKRKKRYEPIDSLPDFSPDKTIKNLKELRKIIN